MFTKIKYGSLTLLVLGVIFYLKEFGGGLIEIATGFALYIFWWYMGFIIIENLIAAHKRSASFGILSGLAHFSIWGILRTNEVALTLFLGAVLFMLGITNTISDFHLTTTSVFAPLINVLGAAIIPFPLFFISQRLARRSEISTELVAASVIWGIVLTFVCAIVASLIVIMVLDTSLYGL